MKKISYLELAALVIIEVVTMFSGINITILKEGAGLNCWISSLLAYIIGFIPLLIILYISNYKPNLKLNEKINDLYGNKLGFIINSIISLLLIVLGITLLYNINNFILSQLLYRTPFIVSCTLFVLLVLYNSNKGINVIAKSSLLLLAINITLYIINIVALFQNIELANFLPLLKENVEGIFPTTLKIISTNILPLITLLIIQKDKITNPKKYNKTIIISYVIGATIAFSLVVVTLGVLGINLLNTFEYPGYIVLRKIELFGFLERIENIISLQWIIGAFIYISIIIYTISKNIPVKSAKSHKYINLIIGIIFTILTITIFRNNTIFDSYLTKIFPYIMSGFIIIYILIFTKILLSKKLNSN